MDSKQKRRTRKQIKDNEAQVEAEAIAAREYREVKDREKLMCIADMQTSIQQDKEAIQVHAIRPDHCHGSQQATSKDVQMPARELKNAPDRCHRSWQATREGVTAATLDYIVKSFICWP